VANYAKNLIALDDAQLAEMLAGPMPGSTHHEQIKFEMERRAMAAQLRAAVAAEKYTKATWFLIGVTVVTNFVSLWISSHH
jgi:hypothetical protein